MRPLVILNPNAQRGRTGKIADELERVIERYVGDVDRAHTNHPLHAVELAAQAARDGRSAVIAVGGDGTIHEVANGLMQARESGATLPKLGIVGQGTGGDFRRTLGLEHRLDRYCQAIASGRTRAVDVGKFRYRKRTGEDGDGYFINILSVGMGGLVDQYVAQASQNQSGTVAYFIASARALIASEVGILDCVLTKNGESSEIEIHTRSIAICNGRYFGSGMHVAPMAKPDDGLFHVVSLGAAPKLRFALAGGAIYSGKHIDNPEVEVHSCERIDIEIRNDGIRDRFPLDVDGEPLGTLPLSIEAVPKAIEVFVAE
jgi:YegS/Rv2252/BmrU family lipid kinase